MKIDAFWVMISWGGHYSLNTLDKNALIESRDQVENFIFVNKFSGQGLQQSPVMGRGGVDCIW